MSRRSGVLEFAVLGLLNDTPMHGYELRKRLNIVLGSFRAFSYGSLYPCLKALVARGLLVEQDSRGPALPPRGLTGKRARVVYHVTEDGQQRFEELLADSGPDAWEDDHFGVHFAFFAKTDKAVRMRILQGRLSRLQERLEKLRTSLARTRERLDDYSFELQRHGLESVEREVRWLNELIESERSNRPVPGHSPEEPQRPEGSEEPEETEEPGNAAGFHGN